MGGFVGNQKCGVLGFWLGFGRDLFYFFYFYFFYLGQRLQNLSNNGMFESAILKIIFFKIVFLKSPLFKIIQIFGKTC